MWTRLSIISNHLKTESLRSQSSYLSDPINFLNLEDLIPADINLIRKNLRKILEKEVAPILTEYTESATFPLQVLPLLKPFFGVSEAKYGCRKVSFTEKALIIYELARIDCSLATFYVVQMSLVIYTIEKLGSEEQKAIYLPGLCSLDKIGAWALTEPEYGSDASSLTTTATPVDGGFLLNGSKR